MLALIYLGLAICVGDRLSGCFFRFVSTAHRWATATLVGLVLSTGFTYQAARHFAGASSPLLWGDLVFLVAASIFLLTCPKREPSLIQPQASRSETWSWIILGLYGALVCWMMFATLDFKAGNLLIGVTQWSDYGPNTAIVQSFAHGHNYPAEYPHWAGEPIRYHFLFYFLAGNLEFLGLNLAWSLNIISILTLLSMLALVMAFGQLLFKSRSVGFIASALFFFHGTLNFYPFLRKQTSFKGALQAIYTLHDYLSSGFPYRGEDWGIWTQVVFINQRHLAASIGIFLIVLIFLFDRYLEAAKQRKIDRALAAGRRPIWPRTTDEVPIVAGIPARREDGEWATGTASEDDAQRSYELQAFEQSSPPSSIISTSEGELPSPVESREESSPVANYASTEAIERSDALAYDEGSHPEPSTISTSEGELPGTVETRGESPPVANYASAEPTERSDTLAYDGGSYPEPSTISTSEGEPPGTVESREEPPQATIQGSTGETQAFAEYMHPEPDTASVSEAQESEALEFAKQSSREPDTASVSEAQSPQALDPEPVPKVSRGLIADLIHDNLVYGKGFIFSGLLLGALPYWNAPVFTAAAAVLFFLFILFPCRRYMVGLAITTAVVSLPQVLALRTGNARSGASLIHWGYTLGNVPYSHVLKYLGWTFGVKWVLILVALIFFSWRNLRLFIALFSLFVLTFCFQFSEEGLANHKFVNIWLVLANLFAAYGFLRLWRLGKGGWAIPGRLVALLLVSPIVLGGVIDLFPIHNASFIVTAYSKDRLIDWLRAETKPNAVFLTDRFVNHPILLAGRKIFFGYTYFTWSAGYDLPKREIAYKQMFESKNAQQVFTLLKTNGIDYVAYDSGIRSQFKNSNEQEVYAPNFKKVFEGPEFWSLIIYKVPENADFVPATAAAVASSPRAGATGISVFDGGKGKENGQFDFPRGLAIDNAGNILVSDTNNGRLQKFSPNGIFGSIIGKPGQGPTEFREPSGIAVDSSGNIYVADFASNSVKKLKPDGTFLAEWKGPEPGFHGPREVAIGADDSVYVVDQGHQRIVKFDRNGEVQLVWGNAGQEDGQFSEISSIAIDRTNGKIYVADPRNGRIEVFDMNGKFLSKWRVEQWGSTAWYFQGLVVDPQAGRLYVSSPTDEILIFDLEGKKMGSLKPNSPDKLEGASSLALVKGKLYVLNTYGSHLSWIALEAK